MNRIAGAAREAEFGKSTRPGQGRRLQSDNTHLDRNGGRRRNLSLDRVVEKSSEPNAVNSRTNRIGWPPSLELARSRHERMAGSKRMPASGITKPAIALFAWLLVAGYGPLQAAEFHFWDHPGFTGNWFDAARWAPAEVPASGDWVQVRDGGVEITAPAAVANRVDIGTKAATTAQLIISDGGKLTSGPRPAVLGILWSIAGPSIGVVSVTGAGSQWINNELIVGAIGNGSLSLTAGGQVLTQQGRVGSATSSRGEGTVVIDGLGATQSSPSRWTITGKLDIGGAGAGSVTLRRNGRLISGTSSVGHRAVGEVTIENPDSQWQLTDPIILPEDLNHTLVLGEQSAGNGSLTVRDRGVVLTAGLPLAVGQAGTGALTVATGAVLKPGPQFDQPQSLELAVESGGSGTLNIGEGGEPGLVEVAGVEGGLGTAVINFNHDASDYHFSTDGTATGTPVPIGGSAAVNLLGGGRTVLRGAHDYTGATVVEENSTLRLDGTLGATAVTVTDGSRLEGTGAIGGPVSVESIATVAPGLSAGTLQIGSLALSSGSTLEFELGPAGTVGAGVNDLIEIDGDLVLDGTLNVAGLDGFGPGVYTLMTYDGMLTDNGLDVAPLPGGLPGSIDTTTTGEVRVLVEALDPAVALDPASIDFGAQPLGEPSAPETVSITNTGAAELVLEPLELTGSHPDDYMIVADGCSGTVLTIDESCQADIDFAPLATGVREARLAVSSNDPAGPHVVDLIGATDMMFSDRFENNP